MTKAEALARIERNIREHGCHVYLVGGDLNPRYSYTIGLSTSVGVELVLAGAAFFTAKEVGRIINFVGRELIAGGRRDASRAVDGLGSFALREIRDSWTSKMLLGALDYYKTSTIPALQVVPDPEHWSLDIPDMTRDWNPATEPVWKWLGDAKWNYPVPATSIVATDIGALRGRRITEAARWEDDQWEMFSGSGSDSTREEMRVVPLAVLIGLDPSLLPAIELGIGHGLSRDSSSGGWVAWPGRDTN